MLRSELPRRRRRRAAPPEPGPSAAIRSSRLTGFTRYSAAPSDRPLTRSSSTDTTTTGMADVSGSALIARSTSHPSMRGRRTSRMTATGFSRRIAAKPARSVVRARDVEAGTLEVDGQQVDGLTVVLDDEDSVGKRSLVRCRRRPPSGERSASDRDGERERASDADLALQPHATTHESDDAPAQREAEAGALVRGSAAAPCWNDSKIRSRSSGAIPTPVSVTVITTSSPSTLASTVTSPPSGVNLTALLSRLITTCLKRSSSASTTATSGPTSRTQAEAMARRALAHHRDPVLERLADGERDALQVHAARPRPWTGRGCR